jgi:hypothetical protein
MTLVRGITDGLKSIIIAKEGGVKPGDYVTIELTQNRLNEYIREWFPPRKETSDVRVTFDGNKGLTVYGKIKQAKGDVDGFISGRFKIVSGGLEATVDAGNFVIFEAEKCKIGKVLVTPMLVNALLRRCIVDFNRDLPIIIKEFELDASNILFAGPVKEDFAISGIEAEAAGWQQRERASAN